jgi:hypothetical protein
MVGKKRPAEAKPAEVEEDEAFPRGGAEVLTALEKRQILEDAKRDFEAERAEGSGGAKRAKLDKASGAMMSSTPCFSKRHVRTSCTSSADAPLSPLPMPHVPS